jgi:hypothetical protein
MCSISLKTVTKTTHPTNIFWETRKSASPDRAGWALSRIISGFTWGLPPKSDERLALWVRYGINELGYLIDDFSRFKGPGGGVRYVNHVIDAAVKRKADSRSEAGRKP